MKLKAIFFLVLISVMVTKQGNQISAQEENIISTTSSDQTASTTSSDQTASTSTEFVDPAILQKVNECQEKAYGELKNSHTLKWNERDNKCFTTKNGMWYSGKVNITKSGKTCQAWSVNTPNAIVGHASNDCNYPERNRSEAKNYCRNPYNDVGGPWCYTTDGSWDYCDVEMCPESLLEMCQKEAHDELKNKHVMNWLERDQTCYSTKEGMWYSGNVSKTISGKTCQEWSLNYPNTVRGVATNECNYPERSRRKAKNYCRNPTSSAGGPWCYTTDSSVPYETCGIDKCGDGIELCQKNAVGELHQNHLKEWNTRDIDCISTDAGMFYSGNKSTTISGLTCQAWSVNYPYTIKGTALGDCNYPERSRIKAKNYCRNPTGSYGGPWCYTTGNKQWETCGIKKCSKPK